jgi:hypothetical protein
MTSWKSIIFSLLASCPIGRAEVEYEIHTGYAASISCSFKRNLLPVGVTVTDEDTKPVAGAVVAIKRIQPDGYTEQDVRTTRDSSTDKDGRITLDYPCRFDSSAPAPPLLRIIGAITVVADGYETTAIECETYFAGIEIVKSERSALAARIILKKSRPPEADPFQPESSESKPATKPISIKYLQFSGGSSNEELSFDWIVPFEWKDNPEEKKALKSPE